MIWYINRSIQNVIDRLKSKLKGIWGLVTGYGLDQNVLDAYRFLVTNYSDGDQIFLFGFSRGAYTIRVLAGFIKLVGLLKPEQENMIDYAFTAYKQAAVKHDLEIAWRYERILESRRIPIKFIGVWDTVNSVLVPQPDRFFIPSMLALPYTKINPAVEVFRHALALDERRRMFRVSEWQEPQDYQLDPYDKESATKQDIKQVWFAGVHSDVGGGYPESESALAKYPLLWMINEAKQHGLVVNQSLFDHIIMGQTHEVGRTQYVVPNVQAQAHKSLTIMWWPLEVMFKRSKYKEWSKKWSILGFYIPLSEPRRSSSGRKIHHSLKERKESNKGYDPINYPTDLPVEK